MELTSLIFPGAVMGGIALAMAVLLAAAAKIFYVETDPRVAAVEESLPGANCGGCGFAGCSACAEAIVCGTATTSACAAGGPETAVKVAAALGVEVSFSEPKIATHYCKGGDFAFKKYIYDGATDCRAAAELYGGDRLCRHGCLGLGTCVRACPFGALSMGPEGYPEVNMNLCVGCGTCERICPVGVIKVSGLSERLLHFQIKEECSAPCRQLCPAQINIPGYIEKAREGKYEEAVSIIKERNPLPLVCGRVCPAPCEVGCRRAAIEDEPVHHNYIKRFVADWEMNLPDRPKPTQLPKTDKKVAIIGGGPSGLTAAYFLARLGHTPVIYEALPKCGGMLRYGIPEYRLPKKVLDFEIQEILDLGCEARYNQRLGRDFTLPELEAEYDAVYLALGAWGNSALRIEGEEDFEGVWKGTEFLQKRELGEKVDLTGKKVVVVGGGNTAMDAARSSLRMGASEVVLLYRRTRKEMPANAVEIVAAEHEGVKYHFLAAPTRLVGENGKLKGIEFQRMELGEPDASGRRRPVPVAGSETVMEADVVIAAIGQFPLVDWVGDDLKERGIKTTKWRTIDADPQTLQTGVPKIFTGGDLFSGPALVVDAIGTGRRAARSIHYFLTGRELTFPAGTMIKPEKLPESKLVPVSGVDLRSRVAQPELPARERITGFMEVDLALTPELMAAEANRCLRCGTVCFLNDEDREMHDRLSGKEEVHPLVALERVLRNSP